MTTNRVEEIRKELHNLQYSKEFRQWVDVLGMNSGSVTPARDGADKHFAIVLNRIASGYCYDLACYLCLRYNAVVFRTNFGHFFVEYHGLFFDGLTPDGTAYVWELGFFLYVCMERPGPVDIISSSRPAVGSLIWTSSIVSAKKLLDSGADWIDPVALAHLDVLRMCDVGEWEHEDRYADSIVCERLNTLP